MMSGKTNIRKIRSRINQNDKNDEASDLKETKSHANDSKNKVESYVKPYPQIIEADKDSVDSANVEERGELEIVDKFQKVFNELNEIRAQIIELQKKEKGLIKKLLIVHTNDMKNTSNKKRKPNSDPSGFIVKKKVGGKFANFLGVADGELLSGPEISEKFWTQMRERNLLDKQDGRILRTDKVVSDIFGVPASVNKSKDYRDKNGFNMITYQSKISYALEHKNGQ
jgi:hypothetical protein